MNEPDLGPFLLGVGNNLETLAFFVTLVALGTALKAKAQEFIDAEAACENGNSTDTAHKKIVKAALLALADTAANSVETLAAGNVEILTASGFHLTSPGGVSPTPVGTVSIASMTNEVTTKIRLNLTITGNVWAVIVERQNVDGTWTKVAVFTDLNDTVVDKLTPGSTNTFRVCAMAATNQTSEYSVPMTGICT
jgi:large exoprotein involved in heme utilization and adhesion